MVYDSGRDRIFLQGGADGTNNGTPQNWEYRIPDSSLAVFVVDVGHCLGSRPIVCSVPRIGVSLCGSYQNPGLPAGFNLVTIGLPLSPAMTFGPPALCAGGFLHALPQLVLEVLGEPASFCVPVPGEPALVGQRVNLQAASFEVASCFRLTDGLALAIQP